MTTLLSLDQLRVGYHGEAMLPPLTLEVRAGQQWALIGPNGAGKTTLIRTLLGLLPAVSGEARLTTDSNIGYVAQRSSLSSLIPARVSDLIRGGVDHHWSFLNPGFVRKHRENVERAIVDTNIGDLRRERFGRLSEGQKQRVLVARALANNPEVLVLDEPTSAMDISAERSLFELLARLRRERKLAVLIVSHHLAVAARRASHAIVVDKDRDFVTSGPIHDVADAEGTRARYGQLLMDALQEASEVLA